MARLQILELPEGSGDDRPPFVLVVDQVPTDDAGFDAIRRDLGTPEDLIERIGARAVLVFEETIDIPGNDVPLDPDGYPVKMRIEPDFETFREQVQDEIRKTQRELTQAVNRDPASERTEITREMYLLVKKKGELLDALGMDPTCDWDDIRNAAAGLRKERDELHTEIGLAHGQLHSAALSAIPGKHANIRQLIERAEQAEAERDEARSWARHGYEIGQKHCGWTDHGVAPAWLTEGWPPHFDSCEHLKRAAEYDEALTRVRAEVARIRSVTPTWGPVADLIDAALAGDQQPAERAAPDA